MSANQSLSPAALRILTRLDRKLDLAVRNLEAISANRDATTGAFKTGSSITGAALRKAWGLARPTNSSRNVFKIQLLAALRAKRP